MFKPFDQDGYKTLRRLEELLCDAKANLDDFGDLVSLYGMDKDRLATQLRVLHSNIPKEIENEKGGMKLKSIIKYLQSLTVNPAECQFYSMVMYLAKLILVMPATNAVSERSFSALRRLKTWLRSTMHQTRLNCMVYMILHVHSNCTDKLDLKQMNLFVGMIAAGYVWKFCVDMF